MDAATAFPYGLRVLVVDDDPTWLKILEKMLRKCSYEVTTCGLARVALDILRERKNKFDIVISDVNMPDMDGFKLLEHIGLEMDLPVIMMSIDGETSRVMKGVQHGACDYLLKPVRMKELRNIWQHVYRKKMHEVKEIEGHDSCDDLQILRNGFEGLDDKSLFMRSDSDTMRKRKDFVNAVNQIGFDKVGPKKILDLMNVPGLTRENVASHLQKYRLYLSRLQKQNEERILGAARQDFSHKGTSENLNLRSSFQEQPSNIPNGYPHASQNIQTQANMQDSQLEDTKSTVPLPLPDKKEVYMEGDGRDFSDVKPSLMDCIKSTSLALTCTVDSISVQLSDSGTTSADGDLKFSSVDGLSSIKNCCFDQINSQGPLRPSQEPSIIGCTELASLPDDQPGYPYPLQGVSFDNIPLSSFDFSHYNDATMILSGLQNNWYDDDLEFSSETMDYPLIDGRLFA
ncbi:hypothetical protein GUJ93_ZPchr0001g31418 [Zizania palustris]|uniref:Response regulatory domain-containing protein n=1 Tax=Zizania palustris TaxID=103762 RepID=A0A8J5SBK4_ZIZPA|nr:hypothetical protein GUJ93_ZPchr0001g31418 [Zizania palustris]